MKSLKLKCFTLMLVGFLGLTPMGCSDAKPKITEKVGDTNHSRLRHQAILLDDGRVLVEGGTYSSWTAEYYDPKTRRFYELPNMYNLREYAYHSLTKLQDGRVLLIGGMPYPTLREPNFAVGYSSYSSTCKFFYSNCSKKNIYSKDVEIFDPKTNQFSVVAQFPVGVESNTTLVLQDGKVLIFLHKEVYLFDPQTNQVNKWAEFPQSSFYRAAAIQLDDTHVFVISSVPDEYHIDHFRGAIINLTDKSIEKIDYEETAFNKTKTLYRLPNGKLSLIEPNSRVIKIFSSDLKSMTEEPIAQVPRDSYVSVVRLASGRFMTVGGDWLEKGIYPSEHPSAVEIYDPNSHDTKQVGNLKLYRSSPSLTVMKNGAVLIIDGDPQPPYGSGPDASTAEILIEPKTAEGSKP